MILFSHPVFPTHDIEKTAKYYCDVLGFKKVDYINVKEPHICLYKDNVEIILTKADKDVISNHILYGYGYDCYFITKDTKILQDKLKKAGAKIVKELSTTDYQNDEFVIEDIDGRWLAFGIKKEND